MSERGPFVSERSEYQHLIDKLNNHNDPQDTAPFDVEAFLAILDGGGTDSAAALNDGRHVLRSRAHHEYNGARTETAHYHRNNGNGYYCDDPTCGY